MEDKVKVNTQSNQTPLPSGGAGGGFLIDGKATAAAIKAEIAEEVKEIIARGGKQPHLAAILVGHDGGSETYVKNKVLACEACGFKSTLIRFEDDVTEEELPYINGYQTENSQVTGVEITPVESAGYQLLNGIQALAYCRIRYTAGSDYRRTERQRTVLTQIFQNAKQQGPVKLAQIVDTMIPYISTSFSSAQLLALASGISDYALSETCGFPFDLQAANISAGDCVVPVNLAQNVSQLHTFLYAQTGYTPSETVQQISAQISAATGIY